VELKQRYYAGDIIRHNGFESNQSGIETVHRCLGIPGRLGLNRTRVELKRYEVRGVGKRYGQFESNQSGIETLHLPLLHWRGARSLNRTRVELKRDMETPHPRRRRRV